MSYYGDGSEKQAIRDAISWAKEDYEDNEEGRRQFVADLVEVCADYVTVVAMSETRADEGSRYHELFGTPERAARTLEDACFYCDGKLACDDCVVGKMRGFRDTEDEVEEWLRGDA